MEINSTPARQLTLTLELSPKEAMVLRAIFSHITGAYSGPRGLTDKIEQHLGEIGVPDVAVVDIDEAIRLPDDWDDVIPEDKP